MIHQTLFYTCHSVDESYGNSEFSEFLGPFGDENMPITGPKNPWKPVSTGLCRRLYREEKNPKDQV